MDTNTNLKQCCGEKKNMIIAAIVIVVIALGVYWYMSSGTATIENVAPTSTSTEQNVLQNATSAPVEDTSASIQKDLESINTNDLQGDFKDIDADLKKL